MVDQHIVISAVVQEKMQCFLCSLGIHVVLELCILL